MIRKLVIIILFFSWFLSSCTDVFLSAGSLCRRSKTITNFGFVGLGAMGMGMSDVISRSGITTFGTDINPGVRDKFVQGKIGIAADSLEAMVRQMGEGRKVIWLMVPHGTATDETIASIVQLRQEGLLSEGDIIIDGGNSNHNRHREHAKTLKKAGIILLDAGTSGGTSAAGNMSIMISGDYEAYLYCRPIFDALAADGGYDWFGEGGAGHFVKSVHNGIEYVLFQVLAEAAEVLANYFGWDQERTLSAISSFADSSPLSSWILELAEEVLKDENFSSVAPHIFGGSTGTWTQEDAGSLGVDSHMLDATLQARVDSRSIDIENYQLKPGDFAFSFIALIRNKMGSHHYEEFSHPVTAMMRRDILGVGSGKLGISEQELVNVVLSAVTYGWLMALKEGFEIIAASGDYSIDAQGLANLSRVWQNGSVIRSGLIGLLEPHFRAGESVQAAFDAVIQELGLSSDSIERFKNIAEILGVPSAVFRSIRLR